MNNQTRANTRIIASTLAGIGGVTLIKRLIKELKPDGKTDSVIMSLGFLALETTVFFKVSAEADGIVKGIFECYEKIKELNKNSDSGEVSEEESNDTE